MIYLIRIISLILLIFSAFFFACGFYSFSGSLPPHLKTISIPLFEDQTAEFGVKEELTDVVIEKFIKDNSLKIADRRDADVLLEGRIVSIRQQAGGSDRNEKVSEMKIYVSVALKCTDLKKRKVLWEETITRWGEFEPQDLDERREGISNAIKQISDEIVNKTVAGW